MTFLCDEILKSESGAAIFGIRCMPAVIDTAAWHGTRPARRQADLHRDYKTAYPRISQS
jgi:hypothetical protein